MMRFVGPLLVVAACGWCAADLFRHFGEYSQAGGVGLLLVRLRTGLLGLCLVLAALLASGSPRRPLTMRDVRWLAYSVPLALVVTSILLAFWPEVLKTRWGLRGVFFLALPGALAALAASIVLRKKSPGPTASGIELFAVNLFLALVLLEGGLTVWAKVSPSPLLATADVDERLEAGRPPPGSLHLGEAVNAGGYFDEPFFVAEPNDLVIAVLADSFGLGVVSLQENFVSVAEGALVAASADRFERIALHNFGVPGIGVSEYAVLLDEALAYAPTLVVVAVFVGNDIHEGTAFGEGRVDRYALQYWRTWMVARRALALARTNRSAALGPASEGTAVGGVGGAPELPRIPEERFLEIESARLRVTDASASEEKYAAFFRGLRYLHERLGERLVLLVIPDEFQVNDALYATLLERQPDARTLDRNLPQDRIAAFCEAEGISCVDVLADLRVAEQTGRTYRDRDTHWNARGNRVAGERLAEVLMERLRDVGP